MRQTRKLGKLGVLLMVTACGAQPSATTGAIPDLTIESLTVAEVEVENADLMVSSDSKIWTMSDAEFEDDLSVFALKAIDTETSQVAFTIDRQKSGCDAIGSGHGSVWVCDNDKLLQLHPETGELQSTIEFAMSHTQGPILADDKGLWLLSRDGSELVHLDPAGSELGRVALPGLCEQLALFAEKVFVACPESEVVTVVDAAAYEVIDQIEGIEAGLLTGGEDRVWVGFPHETGGVGWIMPDGEVGTVPSSPDLSLGCLLVEPDSVWVRGPDVHLARIDANSGEIVETYQSDRNVGGGCVVRGNGSLWIGSLPFSRIWQLDI